MSAAIGINRLYGASALGMYINNGELDIINQEGNLINLEGKYWYNEPARKAGKGFSGSIGYTYKKMKKRHFQLRSTLGIWKLCCCRIQT